MATVTAHKHESHETHLTYGFKLQKAGSSHDSCCHPQCSGSCGEGMRERLVYCPAPYRCNTTLRPNSTEACSLKPCTQWQAEDWEEVGHPRVRLLRGVGNTYLPVCDLAVLCELWRRSPAAGSQVCQRAGICCNAKQPL